MFSQTFIIDDGEAAKAALEEFVAAESEDGGES